MVSGLRSFFLVYGVTFLYTFHLIIALIYFIIRAMKKPLVFSLIMSILISIVYLFLMSPTIYWEDSGEFIITAANLGIAHPPGHPLYIVLSHLFTLKSNLINSAIRVNTFSVFCSFISLFLFSLLLVYLLFSLLKMAKTNLIYLTLFSTMLLFAFSKTFWYYTEIAEVYTLHTLLSISILISLFLFHKYGSKFLLLFSYIFGLSLCNNITIAFLFPAFIIYIVLERKKFEKRYILPCIFLFFLGISFYIYIPLRARYNPLFNWGNAYNIQNFIELLTAREFSKGFFSFEYMETSFKPFTFNLFKEIAFWGILPIFIGFLKLRSKAKNIFFLLLLIIFFNITLSFLTGKGPDFYAYFLPSFTILFLVAGIGIMTIQNMAKNRKLRDFLSLSIILLSFAPLLLNYRQNSRKADFDAQNYGNALLNWLPANSALLTENTNDYFILTYIKWIEHKKTIDFLYLPLFSQRWYEKVLKNHGYKWKGKLNPFTLMNNSNKHFFYTPGAGISIKVEKLLPSGPLFKIISESEPLSKNSFFLPLPGHSKGKQRYSILYSRFGEYYFLKKRYELSIEAFEKAQKYDPYNRAITHNIDILRKKIEQQKSSIK